MANKSSEDQMSVHHEDYASSGGSPSTHNPVARRLFPNTDAIDSITPIAVPTTTTLAVPTTHHPATETNLAPAKGQPQPLVPPTNQHESANMDEFYIPEDRPPSSHVHYKNPHHSQTYEYSRTRDSSPVYRGAYVTSNQIEEIVRKIVDDQTVKYEKSPHPRRFRLASGPLSP
jgi:hypothetical protein